jgi:hypothetical protein
VYPTDLVQLEVGNGIGKKTGDTMNGNANESLMEYPVTVEHES